MSSALLIVAGLAGLLIGADLLVRSGAALASHLGVRPIVVGLTVVALGTSLPELASGSQRADPANRLRTADLRFDLPAGIIWTSRHESAPVRADYASHFERTTARGRRGLLLRVLTLFAGIGLVLLGAELLVDGSTKVARSLDVSEATIGLTVIAIGTSAPEPVTTLTSTIRGDRDLAVGNLLGSTVYNIALILGIAVLDAPAEVPIPQEVIAADLLVLAVVALITVPVLLSGHRISRLEGGAFVAAYLGYLVWLTLV